MLNGTVGKFEGGFEAIGGGRAGFILTFKTVRVDIGAVAEFLVVLFVAWAWLSQPSFSQTSPASASSGSSSPSAVGAPAAAALEFPAIMRDKVTAGATPVGAKVRAKLTEATLVNGVVVPRDALLLGEVAESVARSANEPSRLAIRMDSAEWKGGRVAIRAYLTSRYYPLELGTEVGSIGAEDPLQVPNAGMPHSRRGVVGPPPSAQQPPGHDTHEDRNGAPTPPGSAAARQSVASRMKNVDTMRNSEGAVALMSKQSTIKLDKETTYVFAGDGAAK